MANANPREFCDFDFPRARWLIDIFDEACRALPEPPSEEQRAILAKRIIKAARQWGWDRIKLREAALTHLRELADRH
jgi:hypothetical protein